MESTQYEAIKTGVEKRLREQALPWLKRFIEIPNTSSAYDPEWNTNGLLEQACQLCLDYAAEIKVAGLEVQLYKDEGKTPIVFGTIAPTKTDGHKNLLMYGHIDKQPHLTESWREGLHPVKAVEENGRLYGRGGVDDGYNFFTILALVKTLQDLNIPHDRFILFYECDEESCSADIPYYLQKFKDTIQNPEALFCLDASSISDKYFSITTTLRGCLNFTLRVKVLEKGMHSGMGTGIVPSSFRIARNLLDRIECSKTGKIVDDLQVQIPHDKLHQASLAAEIQGEGIFESFCFCKGVKPVSDNVEELYLNNIWRSQLEVIGASGLPQLHESGNVLRPETAFRCSLRLPPTFHPDEASRIITELLTKDPPYGAHVSVENVTAGPGWSSNEVANNIVEILDKNSKAVFGTPTLMYGCGGSIPFIKTLQDLLPETLLFVSGIVLPDSYIHGPNENMDIEYWINFTKAFSCFLVDYSNIKA